MKPIFIKTENCDLKELMTALENETSVKGADTGKSPSSILNGSPEPCTLENAMVSSEGFRFVHFCGKPNVQEIHCTKDFVAAVKREFPKKEEIFYINTEYIYVEKFLKRIERCSSIVWTSGKKPTKNQPFYNYLLIEKGRLIQSAEVDNNTELTPVQFVEKCAELHPPKSVYDDLKKGDICLVRDEDDENWTVRIYIEDFKFGEDIGIIDGAPWEQVKPTGVNAFDLIGGDDE